MSKTQINFIYETRLGAELYARAEALDIAHATNLIEKFSDWLDENGFTMTHIEISKYEQKGAEI